MFQSSDKRQLFKSKTTGTVINPVKRNNNTVCFLFDDRTNEQMLADGWEAIESSDYVGEAGDSMDKKIGETQDLGLFG